MGTTIYGTCVTVQPEADLASGTTFANRRTSFLVCVVRRQDGLSPLQSSATNWTQGTFPGVGAAVVTYFGLARWCGRRITSCGVVLATRPPFCVSSSAFPVSCSTDIPPSWCAPAHPPAINAESTSPLFLKEL